MNTRSKHFHNTNIYQSCNDELKRNVSLSRETAALLFPDKKSDKELIPEIIKSNDPSLFLNRGSSIPPDEILQFLNPSDLRIPMRSREEFSHGELPLLDLLNALHYYISEKVSHLDEQTKKDRIERSLDETALLGVGILVEEMAEKIIQESGIGVFIEKSNETNESESEYSSTEEEDVEEEENGNLSDISI